MLHHLRACLHQVDHEQHARDALVDRRVVRVRGQSLQQRRRHLAAQVGQRPERQLGLARLVPLEHLPQPLRHGPQRHRPQLPGGDRQRVQPPAVDHTDLRGVHHAAGRRRRRARSADLVPFREGMADSPGQALPLLHAQGVAPGVHLLGSLPAHLPQVHRRRPVHEFRGPAHAGCAVVPRDLEAHAGGQRQRGAHREVAVQPLPREPAASLGVLRAGEPLQGGLQPRALLGCEALDLPAGVLQGLPVHQRLRGREEAGQRPVQRGHWQGLRAHGVLSVVRQERVRGVLTCHARIRAWMWRS